MEMGSVRRCFSSDPVYSCSTEFALCRRNLSTKCGPLVSSLGLARPRRPVLFPLYINSDSIQPRAHDPLIDRPHAVADQVYGAGCGPAVCIPYLPGKPA